jgi:hypothetical protein
MNIAVLPFPTALLALYIGTHEECITLDAIEACEAL